MRLIILFLFIFSLSAICQDSDGVYNDIIFYDDIRSVQIYASGLPTSAPLVELNSSARISLEFDDLAADTKNYTYEIMHCTADWKKSSEIDIEEYLDGFETEDITDFNFSRSTYVDYTHYSLTIPNENTRLKLSGNYVITVFDEDDDHDPIFKRRFMVYDGKIKIQAELVSPHDVSKLNTHHEFNFRLNYFDFNIGNPVNELSVSILQNKNWNNAKINIKPRREDLSSQGSVVYDFLDSLYFEGIKEYRNFDTRSLPYRTNYIQDVAEDRDKGYSVLLYTDQSLKYKPYVFFKDLNGGYVIGRENGLINSIEDNYLSEINFINRNRHLDVDYANVIFSLKSDIYNEKDVYVFGGLTSWQLDESFKMQYNTELGLYELEAQLKQGYYNYQYVIKNKDGSIDYTFLDGSTYDSEDDYLFLAYYKPFGSRYTQLVGVLNFNSLRWRNSK